MSSPGLRPNGISISAIVRRGENQQYVAASARMGVAIMASQLSRGQRIEVTVGSTGGTGAPAITISLHGRSVGRKRLSALDGILGGPSGQFACHRVRVESMMSARASGARWYEAKSCTGEAHPVGLAPVTSEFSASASLLPSLSASGLDQLLRTLGRRSGECAVTVEIGPITAGADSVQRIAEANFASENGAMPEVVARMGDPVGVRVRSFGVAGDPELEAAMAMGFEGFVESVNARPIVSTARVAAGILPLPTFAGVAETIPLAEPFHPVEPWINDSDAVTVGEAETASGVRFSPGLTREDRARHVLLTGASGTGKSTAVAQMVRSMAELGEGTVVLDPHGDLVEHLLQTLDVPSDRIVLVDVADRSHPVPINPIGAKSAFESSVQVNDLIEAFYELYDPNRTGIVGPRWGQLARNSLRALAESASGQFSMLDAARMYTDSEFRRHVLEGVDDGQLLRFWTQEFPSMARSTDFGDLLSWFSSKWDAYANEPHLRGILESGHNALDYRSLAEGGKIVLVALRKGDVGATNAQLLGIMHLNLIWASMSSGPRGEGLNVLVDEAHTMSGGPLPRIASEGRKFGLRLTLVGQYLAQYSSEMREAITGTIGTTVIFRSNRNDAEMLASKVAPRVSASSLQRLESFKAIASFEGRRPFTIEIPAPPSAAPRVNADEIRTRSRATYGLKRTAELEKSDEDTPTILDEWLARRRKATGHDQIPYAADSQGAA